MTKRSLTDDGVEERSSSEPVDCDFQLQCEAITQGKLRFHFYEHQRDMVDSLKWNFPETL